MRVETSRVAGVALVLTSACGGSRATVAQVETTASARDAGPRPTVEAPPDAGVAAELADPELPSSCVGEERPCFPPRHFVEALCQGKYPAVSLVMFQKSAPWSHVFVKVVELPPVNWFGGPVSDTRLEFGEEVLLLQHRPYVLSGPIQDAAPDNYDVLRFDGTCATLAEDEFRAIGPREPRYAPIVWKYLEPSMQQALGEHERVQRAQEAQGKHCRGLYIGGGDAACQRASQKLAQAIVSALIQGVDLPLPTRLPDWAPAPD